MMMYYYFFFNDTATTEIYTLSLHDALPISSSPSQSPWRRPVMSIVSPLRAYDTNVSAHVPMTAGADVHRDRKSTRLNSSHANISYAVFCLKKKKDSTSTHVL